MNTVSHNGFGCPDVIVGTDGTIGVKSESQEDGYLAS